MPIGAVLFVLAVVVFAAGLVAHVAMLFRIARAPDLSSAQRWWSLVPFVAPFVAWRARLRGHVVTWACLIAAYAAIYLALALR